MKFRNFTSDFDQIMLIRCVFARNETIWQKKFCSALQTEILIVKFRLLLRLRNLYVCLISKVLSTLEMGDIISIV